MPTVLPPRKVAPPETVGLSAYLAVAAAAVFLICGMVFCGPTSSEAAYDTAVAAELQG